ncbi:MAG: heme-degrading domain-containing protein [Devosia sp.]
MAIEADVAKLAEQEAALVFQRFDEAVALAIGLSIKAAAEAKGRALAIDVRLWNRPLFFFAMPGTSADNAEWVRRKSNCVKRFGRPSYAISLRLKKKAGGTLFAEDDGVDAMDIAAHGGSFPIRVAGAGIIGAITVSGVPGRDDHGFVVAAIAGQLGLDAASLAFGPE